MYRCDKTVLLVFKDVAVVTLLLACVNRLKEMNSEAKLRNDNLLVLVNRKLQT